MNAIETLEAAIKRLWQVKQSLGFVATGEDPTDLYVRLEEDEDGDGNRFTYGLSVGGGVDSDEEINDALALLAETVSPQLAILNAALDIARYAGDRYPVLPHDLAALSLAKTILGDS